MSARQGKTTSPASSTLYAPSKWLTGPFSFEAMIKLGLVRLSVARKDDGGQVFIFEHLGIPVPPRAGVRGSGVRFRTRHRAPWTWERSTPPARACEKQAPLYAS